MQKFPTSGEINRQVPDSAAAIRLIGDRYEGAAESVDRTDGVSMSFGNWRFNLRASNTEPVLQLLPGTFERVHKSYLVNKNAIDMLKVAGGGRYHLRLTTGDEIPVGRSHYPAVKAWLGS